MNFIWKNQVNPIPTIMSGTNLEPCCSSSVLLTRQDKQQTQTGVSDCTISEMPMFTGHGHVLAVATYGGQS